MLCLHGGLPSIVPPRRDRLVGTLGTTASGKPYRVTDGLAVPIEAIRRVQFDIERSRPATLVIVPEMSHHEPQVLAIPPAEYRAAADALVALGLALHELASGDSVAGSTFG